MELTSYKEIRKTTTGSPDKVDKPAVSHTKKKIPRRFKVRRLRFEIENTDAKSKSSKDELTELEGDKESGAAEIEVQSRGFKLIIINDHASNFLPIVSLNGSPCRLVR